MMHGQKNIKFRDRSSWLCTVADWRDSSAAAAAEMRWPRQFDSRVAGDCSVHTEGIPTSAGATEKSHDLPEIRDRCVKRDPITVRVFEFWFHHPVVFWTELMYTFRLTQQTEHVMFCMFCMFTVTCFGVLYSFCTVYIKCKVYQVEALLYRQWVQQLVLKLLLFKIVG